MVAAQGHPGAGRRLPLVRLLGYYALLVGAAATLAFYVPSLGGAFVAPLASTAATDAGALLSGQTPSGPALHPAPSLEAVYERAITTALIVFGALALALPVAWVYTYTRKMRYDRALVQSVIILPVVIAGVVIVVKDSIALAFSLAGIVAAVRFRNTLQDPRDAVYIFLAIGLGLSAGVQALDIALLVTLAFNLVVLVMWRFHVGAIYAGGGTEEGLFGMGDEALFVAREPADRRRVRMQLETLGDGMKADGMLLAHGRDPSALRRGVETALGEVAKDWKIGEPMPGRDGATTLPVVLRFKKKGSPVELLGDLEDNWSGQVAAAEFLPMTPEGET